MYNLSNTKLLLQAVSSIACTSVLLSVAHGFSCAVLYKALNVYLQQVSLAVRVWELIGFMFMTFGGAPGSNVVDSLDGAHLGPFTGQFVFNISTIQSIFQSTNLSQMFLPPTNEVAGMYFFRSCECVCLFTSVGKCAVGIRLKCFLVLHCF